MEKLFININAHLYLIKILFSGELLSNEKGNKKEIESLDIPTFAQDRENLKKDRDVIIMDYSKAFNEKDLEISGI